MRRFGIVNHLFLAAACGTLVTTVLAQTSPAEQTDHPAAVTNPVTTPEQSEHDGSCCRYCGVHHQRIDGGEDRRQREIEKLARIWQIGVSVGAGLDPELFLIGVHTAIGAIFRISFFARMPSSHSASLRIWSLLIWRPLIATISFRQGRWSAYVGAGPGVNFIHQGVDKRDISFSNFNYDTGLNFFSDSVTGRLRK